MKKPLSLGVLLIMAVTSVNAQMLDEKGSFAGGGVSGITSSSTSSSSPVYMSINLLLGDGAFGYNVDVDWGKRSHFVFELSGHNDFDDLFLLLGYGLSKIQATEKFIFRVFAYPYIGYVSGSTTVYEDYSWGTSESVDYYTDFSYGIAAGGNVGLRLSKKNFLTVGYQLNAPELDFGDMFDYGMFSLGWTYKF